MPRHVVIDNSNILGGAERTKDTREPSVPPLALRLNLRNLFQLLERGDAVATRAFGGSESRTAEPVWKLARDLGYDTYIMSRVLIEDGSTVEQAVDEIVHLVIANAALDFEPPQTLVVASGDSKVSDFGTSFATQIERALKHGWQVEVWHWDAANMSRYYDLLHAYPEDLKILSLDPFYLSLTFLLEGSFHFGDQQMIAVQERRSTPLPSVAALSPERPSC